MDKTIAIKNCPLCDAESFLAGSESNFFYISCKECGCSIGENYDRFGAANHNFIRKKDAIEAWNKRNSVKVSDIREAISKAMDDMDYCGPATYGDEWDKAEELRVDGTIDLNKVVAAISTQNTTFDYKTLLHIYMRHVYQMESVFYLDAVEDIKDITYERIYYLLEIQENIEKEEKVTEVKVKKTHEIWRGGWSMAGESSPAALIATIEADTFTEAVEKHISSLPIEKQKLFNHSQGCWSFWGCVLFPTNPDKT